MELVDVTVQPGELPNWRSSGAVTRGRHHLRPRPVEGHHLDRGIVDRGARRPEAAGTRSPRREAAPP